jgi:hypothetical protein
MRRQRADLSKKMKDSAVRKGHAPETERFACRRKNVPQMKGPTFDEFLKLDRRLSAFVTVRNRTKRAIESATSHNRVV